MYYAKNLTKHTMYPGLPWDFKCPEIPENVRMSKEDRQKWYQNPQTEHWFYSGYEGLNPNSRITASNPAVRLHAIVADLDPVVKKSDAEIAFLVKRLQIAPSYIERSLGRGFRFVWVLDSPIPWVNDKELAGDVLEVLRKKLGLTDMPELDEASWFSPNQLFCNGGVWNKLDGEPVRASMIEGMIVEAAVSRAKRVKLAEVPLDRVVEMIKAKWPNWEWPGDFVLGSQGPTWWIPESTSPKSAVVHAFGMYTFSAHADHTTWTWNEILGEGAIEEDRARRIADACKDIYHDGRNYFIPRPDGRGFWPERLDVLRRHLLASGLSPDRRRGTKSSEIDTALSFIEGNRRVAGAAPLLYRPPGLITIGAEQYLNCSTVKVLQPASAEKVAWGPDNGFPFTFRWFNDMFRNEKQVTHFLSWWAVFYRGALAQRPTQGQASFLCGGPGVGKTLLAFKHFGYIMGGAVDAASYLMGGDTFGGELYYEPVWAVDDQIMASDQILLRKFTSFLKKSVANPTQSMHEKYRQKVKVEWVGRILVPSNLDAWAQTVLPALEDSIIDKVNFYRLADSLPLHYFPKDVEQVLIQEAPYFAACLRDFQIPEHLLGSSRFTIHPYQDESLVESAYHNSGSAGHQEIIVEFLEQLSRVDEKVLVDGWSGTATQLLCAIRSFPSLERTVWGITPRAMNIHLATLEHFPALEVSHTTNLSKLRVWTLKLRK